MSDLSEYAKREAEKYLPTDNLHSAQRGRDLIEQSILHLAARLAEDDVIEAGIQAARDHALDYHYDSGLVTGCECGLTWEDFGVENTNEAAYRHVQREELAAMLAKIAEVPDDHS